ncbi:MAG TPA: hypothetical protein PKW35_17475 [Nannocystaceae bacterium]|nr:hypothetical protein [Nannocystaceae bacterium]
MRDPLAPIPAPAHDPAYWECSRAPRVTRPSFPARLRSLIGAPGDADERFEPLRLLRRNDGDTHGLDRRSRRRHGLAPSSRPEHGEGKILAAAHRPFDALLGLASAHGWALMQGISIAPAGVLLRHVDLLDPALSPELRGAASSALRRLAPALVAGLRPEAIHDPGSPPATIGGCLLASRVIADLSSWASLPSGRRGTTQEASTAHEVALLLAHEDVVLRIDGELVPMTDPQPEVIAVALTPAARERLEAALRA